MKPHKPVRWVNLTECSLAKRYVHLIGCDAKVESPVDSNGLILVSIRGAKNYKEWIKWKNNEVSSDYPKKLTDKLERSRHRLGRAGTCLRDKQQIKNDLYITSEFSLCLQCGLSKIYHDDDYWTFFNKRLECEMQSLGGHLFVM